MELFFFYDLQRLKSYQQFGNQCNNINILERQEFLAYSFPEVGYFNYAFARDNQPITDRDLESIQDFYRTLGIKKHKIKIPSTCEVSKDLLAGSYRKTGTIVKTALSEYREIDIQPHQELQFIPVTNDNIGQFTAMYLESFEAEGRDPDRVTTNFRGLLKIEGTELFLLHDGQANAGVVVLYGHKHQYFLAGGAVHPDFRDRNYHKAGLLMRIRKCLADPNLKSVISWAEKDGISLHNMMTLNMKKEIEFDVYELAK